MSQSKKPEKLPTQSANEAPEVVQQSAAVAYVIGEILLFTILVYASVEAFEALVERVFAQEAFYFDVAVMETIYSWRSPLVTKIMWLITFWGKEGVYLLGAGLFYWLHSQGRRWYALSVIGVLASNALLNVGLKKLFQRARPVEDVIVNVGFYSFPSGHTMGAFALFSLVLYFAYRFVSSPLKKTALIILSSCMIVLVGISRVYLGAHFPSDVIAGFIASFWWLISLLFLRRLFRRFYFS